MDYADLTDLGDEGTKGYKGIRAQGHRCIRVLERGMTLKEIGKKFGLTRERIRQLRRDALMKLWFS